MEFMEPKKAAGKPASHHIKPFTPHLMAKGTSPSRSCVAIPSNSAQRMGVEAIISHDACDSDKSEARAVPCLLALSFCPPDLSRTKDLLSLSLWLSQDSFTHSTPKEQPWQTPEPKNHKNHHLGLPYTSPLESV